MLSTPCSSAAIRSQAHTGVDVARRQVTQDVVTLLGRPVAAEVLHEDEVPDLR